MVQEDSDSGLQLCWLQGRFAQIQHCTGAVALNCLCRSEILGLVIGCMTARSNCQEGTAKQAGSMRFAKWSDRSGQVPSAVLVRVAFNQQLLLAPLLYRVYRPCSKPLSMTLTVFSLFSTAGSEKFIDGSISISTRCTTMKEAVGRGPPIISRYHQRWLAGASSLRCTLEGSVSLKACLILA